MRGWEGGGELNGPGHVLDDELGAQVREDEVVVARVDVHGDVLREQRGDDGVGGRGRFVQRQDFLHGGVAVSDSFVGGVDGCAHGGLVEVVRYRGGVGVGGAGGGDVEDVEAVDGLVDGGAEMGWERACDEGGWKISYQG